MPRRDNEKAESQGHLPSSRTVVHNEEEEREREGVGVGVGGETGLGVSFSRRLVVHSAFRCFQLAGNVCLNSDGNRVWKRCFSQL